MDTLRYPVILKAESAGFTVTFPDMPYGVTCGQSKDEALANAIDCLEEIIASLIQDKKPIPQPSPAHRRLIVTLSPNFTAKVLLYNTLREKQVTKSQLAKKLNWNYPQIDRLFNTKHNSHLSQLVAVASALGKKIVIGLDDVN